MQTRNESGRRTEHLSEFRLGSTWLVVTIVPKTLQGLNVVLAGHFGEHSPLYAFCSVCRRCSNPPLTDTIRMPKVRSESWEPGSLPNPLSPASDAPFLGHVHHELAVPSRLCPTDGEACLRYRASLPVLPHAMSADDFLGRFGSLAAHHYHRKLVHRNFQSPSHLLQGFNRGNSMIILDSGDVGAHKARPLSQCHLEKDSFRRGVREGGRQ